MNAPDRTVSRVGAADFEEQSNGKGRVGFVGEEVRVSAVQVSDKSLRPVALLTGLLIDLNLVGLVDGPFEIVR